MYTGYSPSCLQVLFQLVSRSDPLDVCGGTGNSELHNHAADVVAPAGSAVVTLLSSINSI